MDQLSRREFLGLSLASLASAALTTPLFANLNFLPEIGNPLDTYPSRDWETIYRNQFQHDSTFHFLCAPNDTHNCLLKAYVKNGVMTRIGPSYGYGKATDVYGTCASARWEPRVCQKGIALHRRVQGPRRVKYPMIREGFKKWIADGFPRGEDGKPSSTYFQRGKESFVKVSWDEAYEMAAKALVNIATTYSGEKGAELLKRQGYDPASIEAMANAGTRVLKFRGGMPLIGLTRVFGQYRLANSMALLDANIRGVTPDQAIGARGWDNYSWHTDLPPGHTMVTGQQTIDFDLVDAENAKLIIPWGMNWISTKMPDSHWLTEARVKGSKVVAVTVEYSSVASKSDEVIIIRPATDAAFALGVIHVLIQEKLFDEGAVKRNTDLPFLVRMDTLKLLKAEEVFPGFAVGERRDTIVIKPGDKVPSSLGSGGKQCIPESILNSWGNFVVWDTKKNGPAAITREDAGSYMDEKGIDPQLTGEFEVEAGGQKIKVRTAFDLIWQYVRDNFDPATVSKITWAPQEAILSLARDIAKNQGKTLIAVGMGPNQFFNNDLKDRAIMLLCAMTRNIGTHGGNIGSFAGNYRGAYFDGMPQYILENPFDIELDPTKNARVKPYFTFESAHYFNHGDKPLRVGNKLFTGKSHIPTPTKTLTVCNSNSIIGNIKGHYETVINTLPKMEMVAVSEWWWTGTCEYADIVFAVDSWAEFKHPDATASVTNPFLQMYPRTPFKRLHDTRADIEVQAGIAAAMGKLIHEPRFYDYFKFVHEGKTEVYLQRIADNSAMAKGYNILDLEAKAKEGIPALLMSRTYPKIVGWEQSHERQKWYTKSGRMEFYRDENEFIEYGENMPIYRETVDGTEHEPCVIVAKPHPAIKPASPESYGLTNEGSLHGEARQVRNIVMTPEELLKSEHPLKKHGFTHVYTTPKYRHGAHTTPVDLDVVAVWFGPFGDVNRRDKRNPWISEGYVDMNPADAKKLGLEDGDYVWVDADPEDRPYIGEKKPGSPEYTLSRLMLRVRYNLGIPITTSRSWFNMFGASYGSIEGHLNNEDGLARNPRTGYQAMFRFGSHQSCTKGWLRPTLMTESLARKELIGPLIRQGFAPDVHCPTGAPRDSFVKFTKAEDGGINEKTWRPATLGLRPSYETEMMKQFIQGGFIQ